MDDLISRQAAIDELVRWGEIPDYSDKEKILIGAVIGMLSSLPSVQPQRMRGRWIPQGWNDTYCKCSCCDAVYVTAEIPYNFCPNCGADMRGTTNEV